MIKNKYLILCQQEGKLEILDLKKIFDPSKNNGSADYHLFKIYFISLLIGIDSVPGNLVPRFK